jgi:hypothetical protein
VQCPFGWSRDLRFYAMNLDDGLVPIFIHSIHRKRGPVHTDTQFHSRHRGGRLYSTSIAVYGTHHPSRKARRPSCRIWRWNWITSPAAHDHNSHVTCRGVSHGPFYRLTSFRRMVMQEINFRNCWGTAHKEQFEKASRKPVRSLRSGEALSRLPSIKR